MPVYVQGCIYPDTVTLITWNVDVLIFSQSCIFQYEFLSSKHANRNFVSIFNYVITFHDQAIPRKNPPVKPPARYTFSAANS